MCGPRLYLPLSVPAFCMYSYCHRRQSCRARASPDCDHPGNEMSANSYLEYRNCTDVWIDIHVMAIQHRVSRLSGVEPGWAVAAHLAAAVGRAHQGERARTEGETTDAMSISLGYATPEAVQFALPCQSHPTYHLLFASSPLPPSRCYRASHRVVPCDLGSRQPH